MQTTRNDGNATWHTLAGLPAWGRDVQFEKNEANCPFAALYSMSTFEPGGGL